MTNSSNLFKKLADNRQKKTDLSSSSSSAQPQLTPDKKKRGRPATGKRSDPEWIGRTYYVRRETDLDVETELLQLKRIGIELDKSELVNSLLSAWIQWRQGENIESQIAEISPRQIKS